MNAHDLAVVLTKREGLKKSISVAQVKEVLRVLKQECLEDKESHQCLEKYLNCKHWKKQ